MRLFKQFLNIFSYKTHKNNVENNIEKQKLTHDQAENVCKSLPWHGNDIYLEDNNKQVKAVCTNSQTAKMLAECVECYASIRTLNESKTMMYSKFIQDAYYLYMAMSNAKIQVTSVEIAFVEKAFHEFCVSLNSIVDREHLTFKQMSGMDEISAAAIEVNSQRQVPETNQAVNGTKANTNGNGKKRK